MSSDYNTLRLNPTLRTSSPQWSTMAVAPCCQLLLALWLLLRPVCLSPRQSLTVFSIRHTFPHFFAPITTTVCNAHRNAISAGKEDSFNMPGAFIYFLFLFYCNFFCMFNTQYMVCNVFVVMHFSQSLFVFSHIAGFITNCTLSAYIGHKMSPCVWNHTPVKPIQLLLLRLENNSEFTWDLDWDMFAFFSF